MRIDDLQSLAVDRAATEASNAGRSTRMHTQYAEPCASYLLNAALSLRSAGVIVYSPRHPSTSEAWAGVSRVQSPS